MGTFSCYQLIGVVCGSITGLHVCSLEWLDHPYVPVPRAPPSLPELPHCQVIIPSLIVQSHWSSTLSELLLNHQPWHSHKHLLGSHWRLPVCVPMIHRSQGLEDSVEHRTWSLWARGEDLNLWSWGAQAGAKFKDSCWCLGLWRIQEPPKEDLTVSEKFQLVLDVAQRAQVRHGGQAEVYWQCLFDIWPRLLSPHRICLGSWQTSWRKSGSGFVCARIHSSNAGCDACWIPPVCVDSLFMWVQPELTQKLYVGLLVAFISSCLLPYKLLGFIIGTSDTLLKEWSHTWIT